MIPDSDDVARFCFPKWIVGGVIQASAFLLRIEKQEMYLSLDWLQSLDADPENAKAKLQEIFAKKLKSVPAASKFAVLNVGKVRREIAAEHSGCSITFTHIPETNDGAHCGMWGLTEENHMLLSESIVELINSEFPGRP